MRDFRPLLTGSVVAVAALALPLTALAQTEAGIVTVLQGNANVTRASTTQAAPLLLPLNFKDRVYAQDLVTTGDQSLARILLGGKAVVTVREHSSLRIISTPSTETIEITSGRLALAVAKERMKPGERIDVKTPNAIAGVRGTVLITEVTAPKASTPVSSNFTLLTDVVDVSVLDPNGRPVGSPFTLKALQALGVTGFTLPTGPVDITRGQAQTNANAYRVQLREPPTGVGQQITDRHVEQVANVTGATGGGEGGGGGGGDLFKNFVNPNTGTANFHPSGDDIRCRTNCTPQVPPPPPPPPVRPPCRDCVGGRGPTSAVRR